MLQFPENVQIELGELLTFFGSSIVGSTSGYTSATEKAVRSFVVYCADGEVCSESEFGAKVRNWLVHFQTTGNSLTTATRYLKALSGLYTKAVKENIVSATDIFKSLMAQLRERGDEIWGNNVAGEDFRKFIAYTKKAAHDKEKIGTDSDMVIFSLLNGCLPLSEVAKFKYSDAFELAPACQEIVERNKKEKMQYLFPFNQGNLTPKQISTTAASFAYRFLYAIGLKISGTPDETLRSYWAYAALNAGFSPDVVRSYLSSVPSGMKILSLAQETELTADEKKNIAAETAAIFVDNPRRWFAMHLRIRVTFDELKEKLDQLKDEHEIPELFYPCKEIARHVGKKKIFENQPIIRDIVYFKARVTAIQSLFNKIGDIAWCYKNDGIKGSSYAAIPESSFRLFQQTIGCFTPDFAEYFTGLEPLKKDDDIKVIGGLLSGYSGKLKKIITDTPDGVIRYFVEVWKDSESLKIKGDVDGRQVRKLTAADKVKDL